MNNQSHNNRSNSQELGGNKAGELSEDEDLYVSGSQTSKTMTTSQNVDKNGGGGCGCDSLSQVSEESAFEEDDIEE